MDNTDKPIGIFDSGIGGLTVLRAIARKMPSESLVYFGDTAHVPYGSKSAETVTHYSLTIARFLVKQKVKMIVVACNTASALALEELRRQIPVPVIGVIEPGAAAAIKATRNRNIAVIGTEKTINSGAYKAAVRKLSRQRHEVTGLACPLFVPLVEEGWWNKEVTLLAAREYLNPLKTCGADTLILGCTHYPVIKDVIGKVMGPGVSLVDSAEAIAGEVEWRLEAQGLRRRGRKGGVEIFASDDPARFRRLAKNILGTPFKEVTLKTFD